MALYLALCREDSEQRDYPLRAVFNGLRYIVRIGGQWRFIPYDLHPWTVVLSTDLALDSRPMFRNYGRKSAYAVA